MSYDLAVYGRKALDGTALRQLVSAQQSLAVEDYDDDRRWLAVAGAKRRYCFTVDGPFGVEPEDVPEEVTAAVLGVAHM